MSPTDQRVRESHRCADRRGVGLIFAVATGAALAQLAGCGGRSSTPAPPPPPPVTTSLPAVRLSTSSPFVVGCDGETPTGTLYMNAEVEPTAAVNPLNPANVVAAWQQDRWSDGGAHGIVVAASFDGGRTWARSTPPLSRCAGGTAANGGDYARASDPWVAFGTDGSVYLLALTFSGATFASASTSGLLVTRSTDGGLSWSGPLTLISDGSSFANDKVAIGADRSDPHYVYATWDRLVSSDAGPSYFARSVDGGTSWEAARPIYDPGMHNQTIGNLPLSLLNGTLLVVFTEFDTTAGGVNALLRVIRSTDHGSSWSAPTTIAQEFSVGTRDPTTGEAVRDGGDLPSAAADAGNTVYVAWQDSRFSAGQHDSIVLARSLDGGLSWSQPAQVSNAAVGAFTPNVAVRADGEIGVGYYDLRNNIPGSGDLSADYWLATSLDASSWSDIHVSGTFSLLAAPFAEGLFLGDYQALVTSGSEYLPVFVTSAKDPANRTDVYIAFDAPTGAASSAALPPPATQESATSLYATRRGARR